MITKGRQKAVNISPRIILVIGIAIGAFSLVPTAALAECPTTCIGSVWSIESCTSVTELDTTLNSPNCWNVLAFDLRGGTASIEHSGGFSTCGEWMEISDEFIFLSDAVPFADLMFELKLTFTAGGGAILGAKHGVATEPMATWFREVEPFMEPVAGDTSLMIPVRAYRNEPFPAKIRLEIYGSETGAVVGSELFIHGVPSESSLRSCGGYVTGTTAALRGSWGRLKASYR